MKLATYSLKSQSRLVLVPEDAAWNAKNLLKAAEKDLYSLRGDTCLGSSACLGVGEISDGLNAIGSHNLTPVEYDRVYDKTFLLICWDSCSRYRGPEEREMRILRDSLQEKIGELPKALCKSPAPD